MRLLTVTLALALIGADAPKKEGVVPKLPQGITSFGAAVCDGYVYAFGGHTGEPHSYDKTTASNKLYRLNLADPSKGWETLAEGPAVQGVTLVPHKGKLYRVGGMQSLNAAKEKQDSVSLDSCAVFDPKTGKWTDLPKLPKGRSSHDAAVIGDQMIVVGGWALNGKDKEREWHDSALILNLAKPGAEWETVKQPFKRRALNVAAVDGKIYVVGGLNAEGKTELRVDEFDPATKKWTEAPKLPGAGHNGFTPAACEHNKRLIVSPADGKVYRLNEKKDGWEEIGTLTTKRLVHRIVPLDAKQLLVLGGSAGGAASDLVEVLEVPEKGKPVDPNAKIEEPKGAGSK